MPSFFGQSCAGVHGAMSFFVSQPSYSQITQIDADEEWKSGSASFEDERLTYIFCISVKKLDMAHSLPQSCSLLRVPLRDSTPTTQAYEKAPK
jgi:hypothetical protein